MERDLTAVRRPDVESDGAGNFSAMADPCFQIAPLFFADNSGYSLIVRPGIDNTAPGSSAPEPGGAVTARLGLLAALAAKGILGR